MLDFRYWTTIREFVPFEAAEYRGEVFLAGRWGKANSVADREQYAPVVRVGLDGTARAVMPWPELATSDALGGATALVGTGLAQSAGLAVWQDRLWVGSLARETYDGASTRRRGYGLCAFDGADWLQEQSREYSELGAGAEFLFGVAQDGLWASDGSGGASQVVSSSTGADPLHLRAAAGVPSWDGGDDNSILSIRDARWQAASWEVASVPLPSGDRGAPYNWPSASPWASWRERLWCIETGATCYLCVWSNGWKRITALEGFTAPCLTVARGRLVIWESIDWNGWSYTGLYGAGPVERRGGLATYDGRTLENHPLDGLAPYALAPLGENDCVVFCRSAERTNALVSDPTLTLMDYYLGEPDMDCYLYTLSARVVRPPVVPHGDLDGTVTDGTDPIEAATVHADALSTETDVLGEYAIGDLSIGRYTVAAGKSGYTPESARVEIEDGVATTQDFALEEITAGKAVLYGRVLDFASGRPLYGATVAVTGDAEDSADSGADGFYVLELDPGDYEAQATLAGYVDGELQAVTLAEGDCVNLDWRLIAASSDRTGTVYGWVRGIADGAAIAGAIVSIGRYEAATDEDGYYSRVGIPIGSQAALVSADGYETVGGLVAVVASPPVRADWSLWTTGTATGTLEVTTEDDAAAVLPGVMVTVDGVGVTISDAAGKATFTLPAGTYLVIGELSGYLPGAAAAVIVAGSLTETTLELAAITDQTKGWLWGIVRDGATGAGLAADVEIAGDAHEDNAQTATANAEGFYLASGLWPGDETVTFSCASYHDRETPNVPLCAGQGIRLDMALVADTVSLDDLGSIEGICFDAADHSRVKRARVDLDRWITAYSDALGEWEFVQVAAGQHELDASATGFEPTHVAQVPVAAQVATLCDLPLRRKVRLGSLVVVVLDEANQFVEGAAVTAGPWLNRVTDDEGTALFTDIPEGWYGVIVTKDGYVPGIATVDVAGGVTTVLSVVLTAQGILETDGYLVGYVFDQWSGKGLQGAAVTDGTDTASAGDRGAYALALAAGDFDVTASLEDYVSRTLPASVVARSVTRLDIPLIPDEGDDPAALFVGVPAADTIPEGGPGSVLIDYPEDANWQLGVTTNGSTKWRRAQRVSRGVETILDPRGTDVRLLANKVSGEITLAASIRPA